MLIPSCLIKLLELMLTVACLTLHQYSYDLTDLTTLMLCSGTYVGYLIVLSGEIIGEMIFSPLDLVQDIYFGILGVGLFSVCGGIILCARTRTVPYLRTGDYYVAITLGSVSILNSLIMLFDLSLAYLDSEVDEETVT
ncbi:uncharacterized protein LOC121732468 isoform X1 [Aricia agestis]|uniref:uncharacterized protein LOC121732468 isoform X1 n=1 Tax=Aricia agestis TaxID=91739 RepID=UPI001C2036DF|nr:uncharacterized protein LOC121732468 isoform X1 [Aricia agestis]